MKTNVEKVLDRDAKLSELDDRAGGYFSLTSLFANDLELVVSNVLLFADALQQGASQFEQQAKSLKNKFWLQNLKVHIDLNKYTV